MKKIIALSAVLFMCIGAVIAGPGPVSPRPGANTPGNQTAGTTPVKNKHNVKKGVAVKHVKKEKATRGEQASHGLKKGWTKNTHNPHNPKCDNPGHAQEHMNR